MESLKTEQGEDLAVQRNGEAGRIDLGMCSLSGTFLRKEVIQPHLPIRLPCYDFVPLTGHTFGTSLPCGLGQ